MQKLQELSHIEALKDRAMTDRPYLGICVGMQMLLDHSEEFGKNDGLGIIPGKVIKIENAGNNNVSHKVMQRYQHR